MNGNGNKRSRTVVVTSITAAFVLLIGLVAWRAMANRTPAPDDSPDAVRKFVASDKFNALPAAEKDKYAQQMRKLLEPGEEQQKAMMNLAMARRQKMLDDYFALSDAKARQKYLDEQIDRQEEMRKLLENPSTQPGDGKVMIRRGGPGAAGQKEMTETIPAEYQGKMAQYMKDMKDRRAARGLPSDGPGGGGMIITIGK
jgi:hypothetical protein